MVINIEIKKYEKIFKNLKYHLNKIKINYSIINYIII